MTLYKLNHRSFNLLSTHLVYGWFSSLFDVSSDPSVRSTICVSVRSTILDLSIVKSIMSVFASLIIISFKLLKDMTCWFLSSLTKKNSLGFRVKFWLFSNFTNHLPLFTLSFTVPKTIAFCQRLLLGLSKSCVRILSFLWTKDPTFTLFFVLDVLVSTWQAVLTACLRLQDISIVSGSLANQGADLVDLVGVDLVFFSLLQSWWNLCL